MKALLDIEPFLVLVMAIRRLVMRDWDCEENKVVMAVQRSKVVSLLATWARISIDREFRR